MKEPIRIDLLEKYIKGDCTEAEIALVKQWYFGFEHENDHVSDLSPADEKQLEENIYFSIISNLNLAHLQTTEEQPKVKSLRKWYAVAAAAVVVFALSAVAVIYSRKSKDQQQLATSAVSDSRLFNVANNTGHIYKVTLPDSSAVWLSPSAKISYPNVFAAGSRQVSISGECFFEVTKNPQRPFIISSRSIVTKVWGTSFLVRDNEQSNMADVSVLTGKVSVSARVSGSAISTKLNRDEVMIYPHQKAVYLNDKHTLTAQVVETKSALRQYQRTRLVFDNKPLKDIIPVLDSSYNVKIKVSSEKLNHYILNADFEGFNLPDVLDALKKSLNVDYAIVNNHIELK
ncbi:ferric-dicitrate binding protein FerR, regulates iron transport through sigma-19 [Mucilaginibacter gossypiicola]|uniref:Ferric-dicitrate binding protein FerR, regulates iron transport through sigma-19 n=1 Tax=Mucilaginibacter gossypiicola TaxID=551995 RepID=A0A1H8T5N2_9SPHI|nr:FecR family protein [Mucilaginibacter gossypiicola]SEO85818.1 ferric-dicitrate binding protein FerR, regulates iron transport through sigma-19 [Mucilaginibacter gossypiicola]